MTDKSRKTIRILFPQWQGGNQELYGFGARLLHWLSPKTCSPLHIISVPEFNPNMTEPKEGLLYRQQLLSQHDEAWAVLEKEQPDHIVVFGGDCLVDQAPFAWMNNRHNGEMGVLWIDSHPDVKTPRDFTNGHTMVLGNLLGSGDLEFTSRVKMPVKPSHVMFAGLIEEGLTEQETAVISNLGLEVARPEELYENSDRITRWLKQQNIRRLAVHLDLDVLNPDVFRSLLFAEPEPEFDWQAVYPVGKLNLAQTLRIIRDISAETEIVIIGITEHLPWDAWNLKEFLKKLPIMNE